MPAPPTDNNNLSKSLSGDTANEPQWFMLTPRDVAARLETSIDDGLSAAEVDSRQKRDGPNELSGGGGVNIWSILAGQVCSTSRSFPLDRPGS